ncbi:hypothetical protein TL16_g04004 [Triparma laevis f. inornata]|uniref:START domain-containing protein n=1 Tax=Triparma laevis f. inornata TaxID=1714386 RepID=A0A9W7A8L3_9STRA|nr:hypothetical protein TL16_g04004 [Triparma laevis f. inornata]
MARQSTHSEEQSRNLSSIRQDLPLGQHLLQTLAYDSKQLIFSFVLSLVCTLPVTLGMFLVGSGSHLSNIVVLKTLDDFTVWSDSLDVSITCRAIFIYRLYYFWWELDCKTSVNLERLDVKELSKMIFFLLLELAVAAGLFYQNNFTPTMGYGLLVLLISIFTGIFLKNLILNYDLFFQDKMTAGLIKPLLGSLICAFPLTGMYLYALAMYQFEESPYTQSVIVGVLYPGVVVGYKQFMLGKRGGQYIFGDGMHLNEEWYLDQAKMNAYTSIVRSIHGMYFPQSVGLFLLYFESQKGFILTCVLRIFTQAVIKVATFHLDEQQAILYAKRDGVYDRDVTKIASLNKKRSGTVDLSGNFPLSNSFKKKTTAKLTKSATISQEAAQAGSKFGHEAIEKQKQQNIRGSSMIRKSISPQRLGGMDENTYDAFQTPFMTAALIDEAKLSRDDNFSLAKFIGATKDIENVSRWKAVGKTTHGTSTWLKELLPASERLSAETSPKSSPKSPKASKSNPRKGTNIQKGHSDFSLFGPKESKKIQFKAWREIKDFSPAQIFTFLTMREEGSGELTSTFSGSQRDSAVSSAGRDSSPYSRMSNRGSLCESSKIQEKNSSPGMIISPSSSQSPSPRVTKRRVSTNISMKVLHKVLYTDDKKPSTAWNNVVHEFSGHEVILQAVVNFPTPHRNRELILKQIGLKFPDGTLVLLRRNMEKGANFCAPNKRNIMADLDVGGFMLTPVDNGKSTHIAARRTFAAYNLVNLKGSITEIATKSVAPSFAGDLIDVVVRHFGKERLWPTSSSPLTAEERLFVKGQRLKLQMAKGDIAAQGMNMIAPKTFKGKGKEGHWKCLKDFRTGVKIAHRYTHGGGSEKSVKTPREGSGNGNLEIYSEFVVAGNAVSVASEIAFGKTVDPPEYIESISGHTSVWKATFKVPKPFKNRDNVFRQIRTEEEHSGTFFIATDTTTHDKCPITDNAVRAICNGIFAITPMSGNKCRIKRYAYADIKASIPVHIVESFVKFSNEHFVNDLIEVFLSRREKARVEDILKAREDMLEVAWRDSLDPYTPQETQMVHRAKEWVADCETEALEKWIDVEGNTYDGIIMKRRSIDIKKSKWDEEEDKDNQDSYLSKSGVTSGRNRNRIASHRSSDSTRDGNSLLTRTRRTIFGSSGKHGSGKNNGSDRRSVLGSMRNLINKRVESTRKVVAVLPKQDEGGNPQGSPIARAREPRGTEELEGVMESLSSKRGFLFPHISRLGSGSSRGGGNTLRSYRGKGKGLLHNVASQVRHALGVKSNSGRNNAAAAAKEEKEKRSKRRQSERRSSVKKERNRKLILNPELSFKRELDEDGNYGAVPVGADHGIDLDGKKEKRRGSSLGRSIQQAKRESKQESVTMVQANPEVIKRLKTREMEVDKDDALDVQFNETFQNSTRRGARTNFLKAMRDVLGNQKTIRDKTKRRVEKVRSRDSEDEIQRGAKRQAAGLITATQSNTLTNFFMQETTLRKKERSLKAMISKIGEGGKMEGGEGLRSLRGTAGSTNSETAAAPIAPPVASTLHYGYAKAIIDMPSPMIKAWISDAHNLRGYREADNGAEDRVARYRLEEFNDHSYIDYRRSRGYWPILDREAVLYHISMDLQDGSVHRVKTLEDGRSELTFCFSVCDTGHIPSWILQKRVQSTLGVVGRCKQQLDKKALRAKMTTWKERMAKLRKRMGLKWNVEALVEKTLMIVSFPVCMYLFGDTEELTQGAMGFALSMLLITETISDVITLIVSKKFLAIDVGGEQTWTDAGFGDLKSFRNMILSTSLPGICCLLVFLIVGYQIDIE